MEPPPGYPPMATAYAQPMPQQQAQPMPYAQAVQVGVSINPYDGVRARLHPQPHPCVLRIDARSVCRSLGHAQHSFATAT